MRSSFNQGLYHYLHMLMQIGQEICLIEDQHQASLFSLAATLSVCVFLPHELMIWCDNVFALAIASNPVFLARIYKDLKVKYISSQDQIADVLTKGLPYQKQTHGYFGVHSFEGVCYRSYFTKGNCNMIIVAISLDCCNL